jgi:hypothetical protein
MITELFNDAFRTSKGLFSGIINPPQKIIAKEIKGLKFKKLGMRAVRQFEVVKIIKQRKNKPCLILSSNEYPKTARCIHRFRNSGNHDNIFRIPVHRFLLGNISFAGDFRTKRFSNRRA